MSLAKIIDLVRREDVVLWIGSGFSLYAGFPTGAKLATILYNALSEEEKELVGPMPSLMDLAEQFVRLKGNSRNELNQLLRKEFTKKPGSLKWHQVLAKIPHIRTIITTNYDQLIEQGYSNNLTTVIDQADLAYLDGKTELFKAHGDILRPDSIILTRTDYTNLFRQDAPNNLLWATLKSRLANKTLVFVGYDLEDENVKVTLQSVAEALGKNRKEIFLIAPGLKRHKVHYLSQFDIQYVDAKGEIFLEKLLRNLKDNIVTDFDRHLVSAETFRKFCQEHNLSVALESKSNGFDLKGIAAISESFGNQVSFTLKDDTIGSSLMNMVNGMRFGEVTIDNNSTEGLKILINDVNILSEDATYRVIVKPVPIKQGKVSVTFDDQSEFDTIDYQVFKSKKLLEIKAVYFGSSYTFQLDPSSLQNETNPSSNFTFEPAATFKNVNQAITSLTLALKITKAIGFTIYPEGNTARYHFKMSVENFPLAALENNLRFFEALKKIEHAYKVHFQNIGNYSVTDFNNAWKAATFADGATYDQEWKNELRFEISEDVPLKLLEVIEQGATLTRFAPTKEIFTIYGNSIDLGYEVIEGEDLYIVNRSEIESGTSTVARVKSRSEKVRITYRSKLPGEDQSDVS